VSFSDNATSAAITTAPASRASTAISRPTTARKDVASPSSVTKRNIVTTSQGFARPAATLLISVSHQRPAAAITRANPSVMMQIVGPIPSALLKIRRFIARASLASLLNLKSAAESKI
jgi:hypothetical protein